MMTVLGLIQKALGGSLWRHSHQKNFLNVGYFVMTLMAALGVISCSGGEANTNPTVTPPLTSSLCDRDPQSCIKQANLTLLFDGNGSGQVMEEGAAFECSGNCRTIVPQDFQLTLKAQSSSDSEFVGWSASECGLDSPQCQIKLGQDTTIKAIFRKRATPPIPMAQVSIYLKSQAGGAGTLSTEPALPCNSQMCQGAVPVGTSLKITTRLAAKSHIVQSANTLCSGDVCTTQVDKDTSVRFVVQGARFCSEDNWCWEAPYDHALYMNDIWSGAPDDVWAVGEGIAHYDGQAWQKVVVPVRMQGESFSRTVSSNERYFYAVWGSTDSYGKKHVYIVGEDEVILHYDGREWETQSNFGIEDRLSDICVTSADGWMTGNEGNLYHKDFRAGGMWDLFYSQKNASFSTVWSDGANNVWVAGSQGNKPFTAHFDGTNWTTFSTGLTEGNIYKIFGEKIFGQTKTTAWASTENGDLLHFDGVQWSNQKPADGKHYYGIFSADSETWFAGDQGTVLYRGAANWVTQDQGHSYALRAISGSASYDIWAVGEEGQLLHYDHQNWTPYQDQELSRPHFKKIWANRADDVWVVGNGGAMWRHTQGQWSVMNQGAARDLQAIWGSSATDVWTASAQGELLHYDGQNTTVVLWNPTEPINDLWGTAANNIWAAAAKGTILHFDGTNWRKVSSGSTQKLNKIFGFNANEVLIAGDQATLLKFDGQVFKPQLISLIEDQLSLWGNSPDDLWLGGGNVTLYRFDGSRWSPSHLDGQPQVGSPTWMTRAISGYDSSNVWAAADGEAALYRYNGASWKPYQHLPYRVINAVQAISANNVWAVGDNGTLYHFYGD